MARIATAALLLLPAIPAARAAEAGAAAYRSACAECHGNALVIARRFASLPAEQRQRRWDEFLARHHGGDAEQRAAIFRYFEELLRQPR